MLGLPEAKDELIRAFLAYRHERWMAWLGNAWMLDVDNVLGYRRHALANKVGERVYGARLVECSRVQKHRLAKAKLFQFQLAQLGKRGALLGGEVVGLQVGRLGGHRAHSLHELCRDCSTLLFPSNMDRRRKRRC